MQLNFEKITIGLLAAAILVIAFNAFQMGQISASQNTAPNSIADAAAGSKHASNAASVGFETDVLPKGMPPIYGKEIGISYDDVSAANQQKADSTIKKLGILDQQITLSGKDLERYIQVSGQISCEYCCGTDSIIFPDGKPACGCQHSFAMRGLAKYLIKNHGNEYTNDEVLEEMGKWKTLFFPAQMAKKALVLKEKGIEPDYINLASNRCRGIEN